MSERTDEHDENDVEEREDLEEQDGEELPKRETMSIIDIPTQPGLPPPID